jgi:hypothetical protein
LMDTTATNGGDIGDYYAARYSGWLTVPETGYYHFALKANDAARLYISTSSGTQLDYGTDLLVSDTGDSGANGGFNSILRRSTPMLWTPRVPWCQWAPIRARTGRSITPVS